MNIIDERDVRTIHRKIKKKEFDDMMTLSVGDSGQWVRLLDEGMVVYGDGSPWFYLTKGTLQKFYEEIDPSYVGSINIGHTDLATFPERIIGKWSKEDLRLVDIGDGRMGLDVYLNLMEDHPLVRALRMLPFELGVSAEFYAHRNDTFSEKYGIEIIDGVTITDFAVVGDAGNVGSMGIHLKGDKKMAVDLKQLADALENEGNTDFKKLNDLLDEALGEEVETAETVDEEETSEVAEEVTEETPEVPAEETPEVSEEISEEPAEEPEEVSEETPEEVSEVQLSSLIDRLTDLVAQLKTENASLKAELSAQNASKAEFAEKFKKLEVVLTSERKATEEPETVLNYTDGIGEWK